MLSETQMMIGTVFCSTVPSHVRWGLPTGLMKATTIFCITGSCYVQAHESFLSYMLVFLFVVLTFNKDQK